ncbi:hypothetical protein NP233_g678 [Leucocoprinus birnbaumii]|uniref:lytic cellulose monooxygenase (C4-dehydrogenating) n=1 Tax=Leucocoprinus birnbaumii TaxID=56174 RepID=A0AAD5Z056_9AGAR|nr:hypothetical protein NP233_g678 [Leucocoprinus birnbaumii]
MTRLSLAILSAATAIVSVNAHAYLASLTTSGVTYPGWAPFTDPYLNPVPVRVERVILDNGPVTDVYNANLTCNKGGNIPTTKFANVKAGDTVKFMTYMAKCPNGCSSFKGDTGKPWFKIDHAGWDRTLETPWASATGFSNSTFTVNNARTEVEGQEGTSEKGSKQEVEREFGEGIEIELFGVCFDGTLTVNNKLSFLRGHHHQSWLTLQTFPFTYSEGFPDSLYSVYLLFLTFIWHFGDFHFSAAFCLRPFTQISPRNLLSPRPPPFTPLHTTKQTPSSQFCTMPRPTKATPSRPTPRPSTRSQQPSPGPQRSKPLTNTLKPQTNSAATRGDASDIDNESVCSSSKSSDVLPRPTVKAKNKDEPGVVKAPWRHPDELDYFRPHDWSEDKIISQLRAMVFTVPQPVNGKQSFIEITLYDDGDFNKPRSIKVPRGYRVPLMFVAKFQWASLKLVLTSGQREKEWSDYKFDILHLSRLCQRFFAEAQAASDTDVVEIPPMKTRAPEFQVAHGVMSRKWRCPTFDRALARYNKNWLISREEFLRDFYIEFENEEYEKDVLKIDWSRWALKGHKGFKLTQDELKNGIDARMITRGLKKDSNGKWVWLDDYVIKQEEVAVAVIPPAPEEVVVRPLPITPKEAVPSISTSQRASEPKTKTNGAHTSPEIPSTPAVPVNGKPPDVSLHTPSAKPSRQASSDAPSDHTAKQASPFVEKFHSPLSSLPSSASPSEAPTSHVETKTTETTEPVAPPKSPQTNGPKELLKVVIPSPPPQVPQQPTPSVSEATQPPKSHSPPTISSPDQPTTQGQDEIASTSPLTPVQPDTSMSEQSQDSIIRPPPETELEKPTEMQKVAEMQDSTEMQKSTGLRKSTPTSIDSTPNPSPAIVPQPAEEDDAVPDIPEAAFKGPFAASSQVSAVLGNKASSNPPFFINPTYWLEPLPKEKTPPPAVNELEASPPATPYGPPRPPLHPVEEPTAPPQPETTKNPTEPTNQATPQEAPQTPTPQTPKASKPPTRQSSPVFLSPLLPPTNRSRSPSLDEIPGLGGLSTRQPLSLPPHFVAPKFTARTVMSGSNWLMMPGHEVMTLKEEPQEVDLSLIGAPTEDVEMERAEGEQENREQNMEETSGIGSNEDVDAHMQSPERPTEEQGPTLERPTTPSTPIMNLQNSKDNPVIIYDDDSDMDFGTPVTSPVIIVPGPKVENIEMLPPPRSPSPSLRNARKGFTPRAKTTSPKGTSTPKASVVEVPAVNGLAHTVPPVQPVNLAASSLTQGPSVTATEPTPLTLTGVPPPSITMPPLPTVAAASSPLATGVNSTLSQVESVPQVQVLVPFMVSTADPSLGQSNSASSLDVQPTPSTPINAHNLAESSSQPSPHTQILAPPSTAVTLPPVSTPDVPEPPPNIRASPNNPVDQSCNLSSVPIGGPSQPRPPLPLQAQSTLLETTVVNMPSESTPRRDQRLDLASPTRSFSSRLQQESSMGQMIVPHSSSVSRKRQRDDEDDDEDEDETAFKSRKRGEGLSIREGGVVVRKVVSMVRDTLTGLNDLLEIAAENELIPSERLRGRSKGKGRAVETPVRDRDESPLYTPVLPSPSVQTPTRPFTAGESSDFTRLSEELKSMRAEMAELREKSTTREAPAENDHVRAMRAELEALREQVRVLKDTKTNAEVPEVQSMKDELLSLKNEMRSFQDVSRRPSVPSAPSTPSTPNLTLRFNNHTMANTIHPLAHLLAVEPDTSPLSPTVAGSGLQSTPSQIEGDIAQSGTSQHSSVLPGREVEKRPNASASTPHPPVLFDDIPLPVKSKRKARMIFSQRS